MGCIMSSDIHPAIYNEIMKSQPKPNGEGTTSKTLKPESKPNHLHGDYSQLQVAKHNLQKGHKDRQIKLFLAADLKSNQLLEEREMLSLGTRSRDTSRNTSRVTSPSQNKRKVHIQEDIVTPMTPVAEDKHSRGSVRRTDYDEAHSSYTAEQNTEKDHTKHSPKKKLKVHIKEALKKTSKGKKPIKEKKSKKGKCTVNRDIENQDSGLEEEFDDDENTEDLKVTRVLEVTSTKVVHER